MKQSSKLGLMICLSLTVTCTAIAQEKSKPEWSYFTIDRNHGWKVYYDLKNVERASDRVIRVSVKLIPIYKDNEEKAKRIRSLIEDRQGLGIKPERYNEYSYSVMLLEIKCSTNEGRDITIWDYDKTDKELGQDTLNNSEFAPIWEGSWTKRLAGQLCVEKKK